MDSATVYVGIDVAKDQLMIAVRPTNECWETGTDRKSLFMLARRLQALHPTGIIVEATGGYEQSCGRTLVEAGLPVTVVNPLQVHHFAQSSPTLAKTDAIDARTLAHYGETFQPARGGVITGYQRELRDLTARRRQLVKMQTAESNRLGHDLTQRAAKSIRKMRAFLTKEISALDEELAALLRQEPLSERARILRSVPGIGATSAATLITDLPELGDLTHKQVSALVGVAPFARDSGQWRGKRSIRGGRAALRSTLYMATMAAIRANADIRTFYRGLVERGKPKKVALIAAMRKLVILLNSLIRGQRMWIPSLRPAA